MLTTVVSSVFPVWPTRLPRVINVRLTLTAPGCGMGPVIADDVKQKIEALPGVAGADVEIVFDPPWDRHMISDAAKLELGLL